jgi:hypothetical protein
VAVSQPAPSPARQSAFWMKFTGYDKLPDVSRHPSPECRACDPHGNGHESLLKVSSAPGSGTKSFFVDPRIGGKF